MKFLPLALSLLLFVPAQAFGREGGGAHLVVQQNGLALVGESRLVATPQGESRVVLADIPATCEAESLLVRAKSAASSFRVLRMSLNAETLTQAALLKRFVGKTVTLVLPDERTRGGFVRKTATPLVAGDSPLFLVDGKVYAGPYSAILYPGVPAGLAAKPSLDLRVENSGPAKRDLQLSFLARGITWRMNYALDLDAAGSRGRLSGWAAVANRSGADFPDAVVELLAGRPNNATPFPVRALRADALAFNAAMTAPAAAQEDVFEYHLYTLRRPLSLPDGRTVMAPLFSPAAIHVTRRLVGRANAKPSGSDAGPIREQLEAEVSFRNDAALGLGLPLPEGTLRAYQGAGAARRFLGEAPVTSTPSGATCKATLGQAFDVDVQRVLTHYEKTGPKSCRATWELRIRNAKKRPQRIVLQERIPGEWKVTQASRAWTRPSAGVLEFAFDAPPTGDGEPLTLTYSFNMEM